MKIKKTASFFRDLNRKGMRFAVSLLAIASAALMCFTFTACQEPKSEAEQKLPALTGTVSISGIAEVGQTLTADTGLLDGKGIITFQWMRGGNVIGSNVMYVVTAADIGSTITVTVARSGYSGSVTSAPTVTVPPILAGIVSISGTAEVGQTLTANTDSLGGSGTVSYQWKRRTVNGITENIGINSDTYTVQSTDFGSTITVTVTRSGCTGSVTSDPLDHVGLPPLTGTVIITGTAEVGQTLTANIDSLGGSGTISYQWKRGTTHIGTDSSTYVLVHADAGSTITITVTRAANSGSVTSDPLVGIGFPPLTGTVSISGTAEVGQTLTANTNSLGGSGTISYQWKRGTTHIGTNSSTYVLVHTDAGSTITITVTRAANSGSITSESHGPVTATYIVTFSKNHNDTSGWTGISPDTMTVTTPATTVDSLPAQPARTGYTFNGWNTQVNGLGTAFTETTAITGNITVYAKWLANAYIVTFDKNNADPGSTEANPLTKTVIFPATAGTLPVPPKRTNYAFTGWNTQANGSGTVFTETTPVTANITVYAQWIDNTKIPGTNLAAKLDWLQTNTQSDTEYFLLVTANEKLTPRTLLYNGKTNVTINLTGVETTKQITLSSYGSLFTIGSGVTLILNNNITLNVDINDKTTNYSSLVRVNSGGALVMNNGSAIWGNFYSSSSSYTDSDSNSSSYGGGVYNDGTFTMNGGIITSNTSSHSGSSSNIYPYFSFGGGVYNRGTFTMNGGEIYLNAASFPNASTNLQEVYGGGVYTSGTFTMNGGTIRDNYATTSGSSRTPRSYGGGVYVGAGIFTMNGGTISGNVSRSSTSFSGSYPYSFGGGVYVGRFGTFTMNNGTISGNTSGLYGGGVCVNNSGTFTKTGGTVYGYTAGNNNSNVVKSDSSILKDRGHAAYVDSSKHRETTAGPSVNMDSNVEGAAGGWE